MPYNPAIHHRKSIRLKGYDYSQEGLYFITLCTQDRKCLFGEIVENQMVLNDFGEMPYQQLKKLAGRFPNMELDVFQIMPNHLHAIINLPDVVGAGFTPAQNNLVENAKTRAGASPAPTIGEIIGAYKSLVARDCLEIFKQKKPDEIMGKLWQRNYHEHIIRNEKSYQRISEYIMNNATRWSDDKFYTGVK